MAQNFKIVQCIDDHLSRNNLESIDPVEAARILERAGLLKDSKIRPGLPLRNLLRKGKLPHARQPGGKGSPWFIYHSGQVGQVAGKSEPVAVAKELPSQKKSPSESDGHSHENKPDKIMEACDYLQLEAELMLESSFQSAGLIDELVPQKPGVYCVRITDFQALPEAYRKALADRGHNFIYIGLASGSLKKRFLEQELRAKGHGTFFRSVGAMLGYLPPAGSLSEKKNKRNYEFSADDEQKIIGWMNTYLVVNWLEMTGDTEALESYLIPKHMPLLNLAKNPASLAMLSAARKKCCDVAGIPAECLDS